jgi:proteasome accessory factor C
MPERTTAEARLERILYLLPLAARKNGARLDDLARALQTTVQQLVSDINEVAGRAYYHRAGSGDEFQIMIETDRVTVHTTGEFQRPVRLSGLEALALGLGLRVLAGETEGTRRTELLGLATRLERSLTAPVQAIARSATTREVLHEAAPYAPPAPPPVDEFEIDVGEDRHFSLLADAAREKRSLRIQYLKPGSTPAWRTIEPYRLAYANGSWYVLGRDAELDQIRIFRADRILDAEILDVDFLVPHDFDARAYVRDDGRVFQKQDHTRAVVRYSPRVARWITERTNVEPDADGCVVVEHEVGDADWLVRHVLQYGPEAEVISPDSLRADTRAAAERVLAL